MHYNKYSKWHYPVVELSLKSHFEASSFATDHNTKKKMALLSLGWLRSKTPTFCFNATYY